MLGATALGLGTSSLIGNAGSELVITPAAADKQLSFYNMHTHEKLECCYFADAQYQADELAQINHILRDFRTGEVIDFDTKLIEVLYQLKTMTGSKADFHVISGYRSPKTNAMLRKQGRGVAKRSYHMQGKAIDIFLPDVPLKNLRDAAVSLKAGGVGYYPGSNFIHVDTGRVRRW